MNKEILTEEVKNKWSTMLDNCRGVAPITNIVERNNTIRLLENTARAINEATAGSTSNQASADNFDPILINMVRRTAPNLVANQITGVQPMTGPTGLIFAMKAHTQANAKGLTPGALSQDVFKNAPVETLTRLAAKDDETLGTGEAVTDAAVAGTTELGVHQTNPWPEMGFTIEKSTITAKTRALKARYTTELAQDLKAIHNLDAEAILADLLSTEIVAEQDREIITLINQMAVPVNVAVAQAADQDYIALPAGVVGTVAGTIVMSSAGFDGRWSTEIYSQLLTIIDKMANTIAYKTRRGRGNFILCSPGVATALEAAGTLKDAAGSGVTGTLATPDVNGVTFLGVLSNRYKVYMDPYATSNYVTVGYKGANAYDAGLFMAPYVPLQFMKASGEEDFQPRLGFKTRYGLAVNPFVTGATSFNADTETNRAACDGTNEYFCTAAITGL